MDSSKDSSDGGYGADLMNLDMDYYNFDEEEDDGGLTQR